MTQAILIVDDDSDSGTLLSDLLHMRGFDATAVSSGQQALAHLQTHAADLVLTDVGMPGMSGIELCATLRDRHPDLLSIVITGHEDLETARAAIRAGAYDFIAKPLKLESLELAIARAIDHLALHREVELLRTADQRQAIEGIAAPATQSAR